MHAKTPRSLSNTYSDANKVSGIYADNDQRVLCHQPARFAMPVKYTFVDYKQAARDACIVATRYHR